MILRTQQNTLVDMSACVVVREDLPAFAIVLKPVRDSYDNPGSQYSILLYAGANAPVTDARFAALIAAIEAGESYYSFLDVAALSGGSGFNATIDLPNTGAAAVRRYALQGTTDVVTYTGCTDIQHEDRVLYYKRGDVTVDCSAPGGAHEPDANVPGWSAGEIDMMGFTHICFFSETDYVIELAEEYRSGC